MKIIYTKDKEFKTEFENILKRAKSDIKGVSKIVENIIDEIVEDGNEEGLFNTKYPYECMEMMVAYISVAFDDDSSEKSDEENLNKLIALISNLERMLGAHEGAFHAFVEFFTDGN